MGSEEQPKGAKRPTSPTRRLQDEKRERDLAEFDRQVEEGTLEIRQMTPEERAANPPRPRKSKRRPPS